MDIILWNLPPHHNEWDITRFLSSSFFHNPDLVPQQEGERIVNFRVVINPSRAGGVRNDGSGILTVPMADLGRKFIDYIKKNPLKMCYIDDYDNQKEKVLKARRSETRPARALKETLAKTPYIDPTREEKRWKIKDLLSDYAFVVDEVQFGTYYRDHYPQSKDEQLAPRRFSIEWAQSFEHKSAACFTFEYEHKLMRVTIGDKMTEMHGHSIAINFANINFIGIGYDGKPYLCFDTATPCIFEGIDFHRTLHGTFEDHRKYKRRVAAVHEGHALVNEYAHQLRIVLHPNLPTTVHPGRNIDVVETFIRLCKHAGLSRNQIIRCEGTRNIEASCVQYFTSRKLHTLGKELIKEEWPIAFQIEALLRSGLFNTADLKRIQPLIQVAKFRYGTRDCGALLGRYREKIKSNNMRRCPIKTLEDLCKNYEPQPLNQNKSQMNCYRVVFTPSRSILEGPLPTQSNRVLRQYSEYSDYFIRVDFRDEDRLQYRWDKSVDGASFVRQRVGKILKEGFILAGRRFEFLAYSSSALREHAVWFVNPFQHPTEGWITGEGIRRSVGQFEGTKLLKQPSKYGARLAQAFTATDPGVIIDKSEWIVIDDIGHEPYLHTDGCGTISETLGQKIWGKLLENHPELDRYQPPSVYQIRFLGFKGIVSIDYMLEKTRPGIHMCLRPSMKKFEAKEARQQTAEIEIVKSFFSPNIPYFNRALIMILEDLGVPADTFQRFQDRAIREVRTIDDSSEQFRQTLYNHKLATKFRVAHSIETLELLDGDLHPSAGPKCYDNPFLQTVRSVAKATVLREIKHNARIPILGDEGRDNNFLLIGMADEGPAYRQRGIEAHCLPEGHIFACIQWSAHEKPIYLKGMCTVSRSPVAHPGGFYSYLLSLEPRIDSSTGDIQVVYAIGEPPKDKRCLFGKTRNALVFSSLGKRSIPSMLGGGDVDGDLFTVIGESTLFFSTKESPANYPAQEPRTLEDGKEADVNDICDFIVEYINSDVLGLLSDRLLVIADQSKEGIRDKKCLRLAELCSQAVDYPKNGNSVDLDIERLPHTLIRCKPDWHAAEIVDLDKSLDYYESSRALGKLFRDPNLDWKEAAVKDGLFNPVLPSPITELLRPRVEQHLKDIMISPPPVFQEKVLYRYAEELRYICTVNTLTNAPGVTLLEAEVVVGTILAKCTQRRFRSNRIDQMRIHTDMLIRTVQKEVQMFANINEAPKEAILSALQRAWILWDFTTKHTDKFGANSLGLLALRMVCDQLDRLDDLVVIDSLWD